MKKAGGKKAVEDMIQEVGEEAAEKALKIVGKSTLKWQKHQVERLAFIIKNPPPGGDRVINNIDALMDTKGIQGCVDSLYGGFDHEGGTGWMKTQKGPTAELQIAAEEIKPENIVELRPTLDGKEQADILAKNPHRAIQIKNRNSANKCVDELYEQFPTTKSKYPSHRVDAYVPNIYVSEVQTRLSQAFPFEIKIFPIPA